MLKPLLIAGMCMMMGCLATAQLQQLRITRSYEGQPMAFIFEDLAKYFDVHFAGDLSKDTALRTTLDLDNATLETALYKLLQPFHHRFAQEGRMFSIKYSEEYVQVVTGQVRNEHGNGVGNVNVSIIGTNITTATGPDGLFRLKDVPVQSSLLFTNINTVTQKRKLEGRSRLDVILQRKIDSLQEFNVIASNGIRRFTIHDPGSYHSLDLTSTSQRATANITGYLDHAIPGMSVQHNNLQIRSLSTIHADRQPLIILDGFPYDGDINSIHPNEIESITVLKDAMATAIWGVRAGNGTIVIQRKKSQFKQTPKAAFYSGFLITPKLNPFKNPGFLPSDQFIEVETFLFQKGHFNAALADERKPVSPVAQILFDELQRAITSTQAAAMLDSLGANDVRKDISKFLLQNDLSMQYGMNLSGADSGNAWHLFVGYNTTTTGRVNNGRDQLILNIDNTHQFANSRLQLATAVRTAFQKDQNNNLTDPGEVYPYSMLAGKNGEALAITKENKPSFLAQPQLAQLLDWEYRPLDELRLADNATRTLHLIADVALHYSLNDHFSGKAYSRLERRVIEDRNFRSIDSWYTRNLINKYTQLNGTTIGYGVPRGNMLDKGDQRYRCENLGAQLRYFNQWDSVHRVELLLGGDVKATQTLISTDRLYGYDPDQETSVQPNYNEEYLLFGTGSIARVPNMWYTETKLEHYVSGYFTGNYTFRKQLTLSASARQDKTNVFGWKTNNRFAPLYALGVGWQISRALARYIKLPYARIRITRGATGNVYKPASSLPTIVVVTDNQTNQTIAVPVAPANPDLRYEKSTITNFGIDLTAFGGQLAFSGDFYAKKGTDLFGRMRTDPGTGFRDVLGNYATMKGSGIELSLCLTKTWGHVSWESMLGHTYATDKVTQYQGSRNTVSDYLNIAQPTALQGHSLNAVYSTKMTGLDEATGTLISDEDFNEVLQSTNPGRYLVDEGSSVPRQFGFFTNTLSWRALCLRINISYKMNYVFRRSSINYDELFNNKVGHTDFAARWKHTGDEIYTMIPAMTYPADKAASNYYSASDMLIVKADHIRLQDVNLSCTLNKIRRPWLPCKQLIVQAAVSNPCMLWRSNRFEIDPDNPLGYKLPATYLFSMQISL